MVLPERARSIVEFWFGALDGDGMPARRQQEQWFRPDPAFDAEVAARFGPDLGRIDELGAWEAWAEGALALVLLADQFPRNIHRGRPEAFAFDERARAVTRRALDAGRDRELLPIQRVFLLMPLEHAEDLELQDESVRRFRALAEEVPAHLADTFASFVAYAENHREVIARFGRFPHRNRVLGRPDTAAERAWLGAGGATWGQGG